ncbi:hypothetical protein BLOT_001233 [Blomia tropicalis]|nr:hypothetical protein BLOT_001233 [Blomia tropicalis]
MPWFKDIRELFLAIMLFPLSSFYLFIVSLWKKSKEKYFCPVVRIRIRGCEKNHNHHDDCTAMEVRALLDSAESVSLISERIVRHLSLQKFSGQPVQMQSQFGDIINLDQIVKVRLESLDPTEYFEPKQIQLVSFPLDRFSKRQNQPDERIQLLAKTHEIRLSDQQQLKDDDNIDAKNESDEIDLVIGQDLLHSHFQNTNISAIKIGRNEHFIPTNFGYVYQGGKMEIIAYNDRIEMGSYSKFTCFMAVHRIVHTLMEQRSLLYHLLVYQKYYSNLVDNVEQKNLQSKLYHLSETPSQRLKIRGSNRIISPRLRESYFRYMLQNHTFSIDVHYFPTIRLQLIANLGSYLQSAETSIKSANIRALLDTGSNYSMLSPRIVYQLQLSPKLIVPIVTTDLIGSPSYLYSEVVVQIEPLVGESKKSYSRSKIEFARFYVQPIDRIQRIWRSRMNELISTIRVEHPGLALSDDFTDDLCEVDALIGQDLLSEIIIQTKAKDFPLTQSPRIHLTSTNYGWVISGVRSESLIE